MGKVRILTFIYYMKMNLDETGDFKEFFTSNIVEKKKYYDFAGLNYVEDEKFGMIF